MRDIEAGSTVWMKIKVRDVTLENKPLFDPAGGVKVTIRRPDGTVAVDDVAMTKTAVGTYTYTHQTTTSDAKGVWTISIKAVNGSHAHITPRLGAFKL